MIIAGLDRYSSLKQVAGEIKRLSGITSATGTLDKVDFNLNALERGYQYAEQLTAVFEELLDYANGNQSEYEPILVSDANCEKDHTESLFGKDVWNLVAGKSAIARYLLGMGEKPLALKLDPNVETWKRAKETALERRQRIYKSEKLARKNHGRSAVAIVAKAEGLKPLRIRQLLAKAKKDLTTK